MNGDWALSPPLESPFANPDRPSPSPLLSSSIFPFLRAGDVSDSRTGIPRPSFPPFSRGFVFGTFPRHTMEDAMLSRRTFPPFCPPRFRSRQLLPPLKPHARRTFSFPPHPTPCQTPALLFQGESSKELSDMSLSFGL